MTLELPESRYKIPELTPKPTRTVTVLLLGSYDNLTKKIMRDLVQRLSDRYDPEPRNKGRRLVILLAEDVTIFQSRPQQATYVLVTERYGSTSTFKLFKDGKMVETFDCPPEKFPEMSREVVKSIAGSGDFAETSVTNKVKWLAGWADLIGVVKDQEVTLGGELIELTLLMALDLFTDTSFSPKTVIFQKNGIVLSWMLEELMKLGRFNRVRKYDGMDGLVRFATEEIDIVIDRLRLGSRP